MTRLRLWGPAILWMAILFYASAQAQTGSLGQVPDWITHGAAYLVLGLLLGRALAGGLDRPLPPRLALLALLLGTLYGVSDEFHQSLVPGRDASAWDVAKDVAGCSLAVALHVLRTRRDV